MVTTPVSSDQKPVSGLKKDNFPFEHTWIMKEDRLVTYFYHYNLIGSWQANKTNINGIDLAMVITHDKPNNR